MVERKMGNGIKEKENEKIGKERKGGSKSLRIKYCD
jgi:hypothetical protein